MKHSRQQKSTVKSTLKANQISSITDE